MMTPLERITKNLRGHLAAYPQDAAVLLAEVSVSLDAYRKACETARDSIASTALQMQMGWGLRGRPLAEVIDAALYVFPSGLHPNHSISEKRWWREFIALAVRDGAGDSWLACKGPAHAKWWARVVVPAMDAAGEAAGAA